MTDTTTRPGTTVALDIGGMTCASCAARISKKLNRLDGVEATVNYATEKAQVRYPAGLTPQDLVATVEATGYTATVPPRPAPVLAAETEAAAADPQAQQAAALRQRLLISLALCR